MLLLAGTAFGWSRDFGTFLLGLVVLPLLALMALIGVGFAAFTRLWTTAALTSVIAISSFPAFLLAGRARNPVRFALWSIAHKPLGRFTRHDGVIAYWDGWGMAGSENDSYLVADPADAIGSAPAADRWRRRMRLACEVVDSRRVAARLYILTTYNCPFNFNGRVWS